MLPQHRYRHPKFLQQDQSRRCCSRQRARSHQSGCPVLLVPFPTCRTGQRRHRTGVPVVCSSPDYMACHSQIFPSIWASARSDDLPVLTQSAPEIRVLPMSVQGPVSRASREDPRRNCTRDEGGPLEFGNRVDLDPPQPAVVKIAERAQPPVGSAGRERPTRASAPKRRRSLQRH
jgi:hypothetical protein